MKIDSKKWIENFDQELIHLKIEFDAFFAEGQLTDYYDLEVDDKTGLVSIAISKSNALPKEIADALTTSFIKSRP